LQDCNPLPFLAGPLALLCLLGPSRPRCLLCSLGSLLSGHALGGIGPTLLSATHRAIFHNDKPGIGMNRAMFRHSRLRYQIAGIGDLSHHDFNLQSVECFANVVVAVLDDPGEVWPLGRVVCFRIPDFCQQLRRFLGDTVAGELQHTQP